MVRFRLLRARHVVFWNCSRERRSICSIFDTVYCAIEQHFVFLINKFTYLSWTFWYRNGVKKLILKNKIDLEHIHSKLAIYIYLSIYKLQHCCILSRYLCWMFDREKRYRKAILAVNRKWYNNNMYIICRIQCIIV